MNPCIELCWNRYGKQYSHECDTTCEYAKVVLENKELKYELSIREEMMKLSATHDDFALLSKELIWNSFIKRRQPKDVAWAIMQ